MDEIVADLHYVIKYAEALREHIMTDKPITTVEVGYAARMQELATKVTDWVVLNQTKDPE